jgi:hypothetical protein
MLTESLNSLQEQGDTWGVAQTLTRLGDAYVVKGDKAMAAAAYGESLACHRRLANQAGELGCWEALAHLILVEHAHTAALLLSAAAHVRMTLDVPRQRRERPIYEQALVTLRVTLGEQQFAAAWKSGSQLAESGSQLGQILDDVMRASGVHLSSQGIPRVAPSVPAAVHAGMHRQ